MPWILEYLCDSCLWDGRKSKLLQHSLARLGPWRIFPLLDHRAESERWFWLETWTAKSCTVLLAGVLGQADVAVFQDKGVVIHNFPHHAERLILRVTTPALPVYLLRLP